MARCFILFKLIPFTLMVPEVGSSSFMDLRVFEDAITFKIALMVVKYMKYMELVNQAADSQGTVCHNVSLFEEDLSYIQSHTGLFVGAGHLLDD